MTSEVYPFAKTGGLADVSYSLPLALRELGHDIRVMAPKYGSISERKNRIHEINRLRDIPIPIGDTESYATVKSSSINNPRSKVQAYITTNSNYFDAKKVFMQILRPVWIILTMMSDSCFWTFGNTNLHVAWLGTGYHSLQ